MMQRSLRPSALIPPGFDVEMLLKIEYYSSKDMTQGSPDPSDRVYLQSCWRKSISARVKRPWCAVGTDAIRTRPVCRGVILHSRPHEICMRCQYAQDASGHMKA